ncbi:hypothetical protein [Aureibacter tunicatorum]|uniref:Lipoprotein n=1 Tax=Aureibacter tunicatorum TaxID=866807 RepID=A0AAE4BQQ0_9BACT|nr:hypothetical protein [Aureibacter tunicatorum]MDR6237163.1 hypothetical protein [Aureibacter tunicatorum]BDD06155.1 hypothetical protein AUTU_36380 [Aureibacter tunicatorum]
MKKPNIFKKSFVALGMATMVMFTACKDDENDNPNPEPLPGDEIEVSGDITEDMKWEAGTAIVLAGGVHVAEGVTLTIDPGVVVKSKSGESIAYLLVEQGGKIIAEGTAAKPIVFTSGEETPARGDWGGVIICGDAPVNGGDGEGERTAEVGDVKYGGSNEADNSGVLKYVRVEYTGNAINDEKEHNGFTFNGVGSGTTLMYLQSHMGGDDAFEFFGGTVNAENLLATGAKDDSFDWTYGWSGKGTNWKAVQAEETGDRGIEADNNSKDFTANPVSNPTLDGITLIGNGAEKDGKSVVGVKLRAGTNASIMNLVVSGFSGYGVEVETEESTAFAINGDMKVDAKLDGNGEIGYNFKEEISEEELNKIEQNLTVNPANTGADESVFEGWTVSVDYKGGAPVAGTPLENGAVISGDIEENTVLTEGNTYELAAGVHVKDGAALIIQPGVTIKSKVGEAIAYLLIEKGARILAEGTADKPIVFTSGEEAPSRGDWGGIIVCGKAPINGGGAAGERTAEVGDVKYGGNNPEDYSGVLKYVRVEYTGNAINDEKEHNGFTFNGVGNRTIIENIQAYMGGDDGIEFFGGTVNVMNVVSTGSKDDSFDWTYGWSGKATNLLAIQADDAGDRGIEADNNSKDFAAGPVSNPTLENVTLIGNGRTDGEKTIDGVKLRAGTNATITNLVVTGFSGYGVEVETSESTAFAISGSMKVDAKLDGNAEGTYSYKEELTADQQEKVEQNLTINDSNTGAGSLGDESWVKKMN